MIFNKTPELKSTEILKQYHRPSEWLSLPVLNEGDQKFVGLYAVYPNINNIVSFRVNGNYMVNWGDGTQNIYSGGTIATKNILYSGFTSQPETLRGYKQTIITIIPQNDSNLTSIELYIVNNYSNWLDISICGSFISSLIFQRTYILEIFNFIGTNNITNFNGMFQGCSSLQTIPVLDVSKGTDFNKMFNNCSLLQTIPLLDTGNGIEFSDMFNNCTSLQTIPLLNTSNGTYFYSMFNNCSLLQTIPLLNTSNGTYFYSMFQNCTSLQTIPLLNTTNGTNFGGMFQNCTSLQTIPLLNTSNGTYFYSMFQNCTSLQTIPLLNTTNGTNFGGMFQNCTSLQTIPLLNTSNGTYFYSMFRDCRSLTLGRLNGTKKYITYDNCNLSATALNDIYEGLGIVTNEVITIRGNRGSMLHNPSIAINKGWTVVK